MKPPGVVRIAARRGRDRTRRSARELHDAYRDNMQQHAHEGPWRGHRRCPYPSFRRGGNRPAAVGGGIVGLIVLLGAVFFNVDLSGVANLADGGSGGARGGETIGSVDDCTA